MTYLIAALVLACVVGSAIGWELSKDAEPRRQLTYVIACAALMVVFALVVNALVVRLLD